MSVCLTSCISNDYKHTYTYTISQNYAIDLYNSYIILENWKTEIVKNLFWKNNSLIIISIMQYVCRDIIETYNISNNDGSYIYV